MKIITVVIIALLISGCGTTPTVNVVNAAKCVTEVATKESKFTCEFEGKKILAKE